MSCDKSVHRYHHELMALSSYSVETTMFGCQTIGTLLEIATAVAATKTRKGVVPVEAQHAGLSFCSVV